MDIRDSSGMRTTYDLERKYIKQLLGVQEAVKVNRDDIYKTNTTLEDFTASTLSTLENMQDQIDGNITTYFHSGVPTLNNYPANEWNPSEYNNHIGDLYYDSATGYAYRFSLENDTYKWLKLSDSDVTEALAIANAAQDTADSKRRVFVVEPYPPYDVGDIWFNNQELYRCKTSREEGTFQSSDWMIATKYTDDTAANNAMAELNAYKTLVQSTYVTNSTFETTTNSISGRVTQTELKVDSKAQVFRSTPTVPYYENDVYITNGNVYLCTNEKTEGSYDASDWTIQVDTGSLVTGTEFNQTVNQIEFKVNYIGGRNLTPNTTQWHTHSTEDGGEENIDIIQDSSVPSGYASKFLMSPDASINGESIQDTPNLFDKTTITENMRLDTSGNYYTDTNCDCSDYIEVVGNSTYTKNIPASAYECICFYDSDKTFISRNITNVTFTTPVNAKYIRITCYKTNLETLKLIKTAMPSSPIPIETITGNTSIEIPSGKNFWRFVDKNYFQYGNAAYRIVDQNTLIVNSTSSGTYRNVKFMFNIPDGTYTFSVGSITNTNTSFTNNRIEVSYMTNGTRTILGNFNSSTPQTFTIENQASRQYVLEFWATLNNSINNTATFSNVQIEKGSSKTDFESYKSKKYNIDFGNYELSYIQGVAADNLYNNGENWYIQKNVGKTVLNGSENWTTRGGGATYAYVLADFFDAPQMNGLSDYWYFYPKGATNSQTIECLASANTDNRLSLFTYNSNLNTVDNLKTWLSENKPTVYYQLVTPTTTQITDTNLINQLNSIRGRYFDFNYMLGGDLSKLSSGGKYTLSCYVKADEPTTLIMDKLADNQTIISKSSDEVTTSWTRKYITFNWTDSDYMTMGWYTDSDLATNYYVSSIKLEAGDTATAWSPAPEDTLNRLNEIDVDGAIQTEHQIITGMLDNYATTEVTDSLDERVGAAETENETNKNNIADIRENGVSKVVTTAGYVFDATGLHITRTGAKTSSLYDETGITITDQTSAVASELFFAGFDNNLNESIVRSKNITVDKYLVIGNHLRIENYQESGENAGTGFFYI